MGDNNSTIQILRATKESIINNSQTVLAAGTPLYNKEDHYLYIADGTSKANELTPIVVKEMQVYEDPNLSRVEVTDGHYINIRNSTTNNRNVDEKFESKIKMNPNVEGSVGELTIHTDLINLFRKASIYNELSLIGGGHIGVYEGIPDYNMNLGSSYSTETNTYRSGMALLSTEGLHKLTGNPKVTLYAIRDNSSLHLELTAARLNLYRDGSKDGFLTIDNANNMNLTGDIQCNSLTANNMNLTDYVLVGGDLKANDFIISNYSNQSDISLKDNMLWDIDQSTKDIVVKKANEANKLNKFIITFCTIGEDNNELEFNISSADTPGIYNLTLLNPDNTKVWNLGNFTYGKGNSHDSSSALIYYSSDGTHVLENYIFTSIEKTTTNTIMIRALKENFFGEGKYTLLCTRIADMPL